jgi:tetratricopeptide (TPR) repeat protein
MVPRNPKPRATLVLLAAGLSVCALSGPLRAQPGTPRAQQASVPAWLLTPYPTANYFTALSASFYGGRYPEALKAFAAEELSSPLVTVQSPHWIDAICSETMAGECCYEMGEMGAALEHYTSALKLFLAFPDWMNQVASWPVGPAGLTLRRAPWGASGRGAAQATFLDPLAIVVPKAVVNSNLGSDSSREPAVPLQLHAREIVRCTTLAIRRRAALLGPAARHDLVLNQVLAALARRPAPPGPWPQAWIDLELGAAQAAVGRDADALATLQRAVLVGGRFDHPLTGSALLQLGLLYDAQGNWDQAARHFAEATCAAAQADDFGDLEEAFRWGAITHFLINRKEMYPPLPAALAWSSPPGLPHLHASLAILAAEDYALLGRPGEAANMLEQARGGMAREMAAARLGARLNYVAASLLFQQRRTREAQAALAAAMEFMRKGSVWLCQIAAVDDRCAGRTASAGPREAMLLYARVLREPQPGDWAADPMEPLAVLSTPHPVPLEHWLEAAIERKDYRAAVEIAERLRRHRFYASLPLGGRLMAMRWLLEGPESSLAAKAREARHDILLQHPEYADLSQQARRLAAALGEQPWAEGADERKQTQQLERLAALGARQEAALAAIALSRAGTEMVFPPLRTTAEIQSAVPDRQALVAFLSTRRAVYGFLIDRQRCNCWQVQLPLAMEKPLAGLLRQVAFYEHGREPTPKELADPRWKAAGRDLLAALLRGSRLDLSQPLDELVVVPDGVLWYVPFEALGVEAGGELQPLGWRLRVRYLPTASLVVPDGRTPRPMARTAVAVGKLGPRQSESGGAETAAQIARVLPGTSALPARLPGPPCACATMLDRLIVPDPISLPEAAPYAWSLLGREGGRGSTLDDWMGLPWPRPEVVVLSGFHFHRATEKGLKHAGPAAGQEVFLAVCGLMASGARTILMGRWSTGDPSACDLVREFVEELPYASPAEAWQRSVLLLAFWRSGPAEPQLKAAGDATSKEAHPYFWSGYMLVDSAGPRANEEPRPRKP